VLVPKALFSAKDGYCIRRLELGRDPAEGDDVASWPHILERLRTEYGFCHGDADGRNGIFIKDNQGGE
jgi:hypothetical protein